jgi:TrmH family RNA methyltransferase
VLEQFVIVLHRPRNVVNIGGVVRAMKTMGFQHLRLVEPVPFTVAEVTAVAHRSEDILATTRSYDNLAAALADMTYVVGTTEHAHGRHVVQADIRSYAPYILQQTASGRVALLFGPEDNGLDTVELDQCHMVVRLPTVAAYPSLNLAQAALLLMYELRMVLSTTQPALSVNAGETKRASTAQVEALFAAWEGTLQAVDFFRTRRQATIMRPLRAIVHRACPDEREARLLTAMAREISKVLRQNDSTNDDGR